MSWTNREWSVDESWMNRESESVMSRKQDSAEEATRSDSWLAIGWGNLRSAGCRCSGQLLSSCNRSVFGLLAGLWLTGLVLAAKEGRGGGGGFLRRIPSGRAGGSNSRRHSARWIVGQLLNWRGAQMSAAGHSRPQVSSTGAVVCCVLVWPPPAAPH